MIQEGLMAMAAFEGLMRLGGWTFVLIGLLIALCAMDLMKGGRR
jgi:hypothetical protein